MTTLQAQQGKTPKSRKDPHMHLFQTHSPPNRNLCFETVYEKFKKEAEQATKNWNHRDIDKKTQQLLEQHRNQGNILGNKNGGSRKQQLEIEVEAENKRTRALSSNKFDCLPRKSSHRKGKRLIKYLFEMAKQTDQKEGSSKKSTDDSNSSEIQKMKAENIQFEQQIQQKERKATLLEKQIMQERKKHELQKQLYQHNIDKLKKKVVGKEVEQLEELQQLLNSHQQFDRLSIESN